MPAQNLPGQVLMFQKEDLVEDEEWGAVVPRQKGAAIWPMSGNTTRGLIMAGLREQGHRTLMEVDDNYILGVDPSIRGADWAETIAAADGRHSYEAHAKLCKWVDGIIVSTENLARHYARLNPNVYICPNSVDPADWPEPEKPNDGVLRIGWGASHSHLPDAPLVHRALEWASQQKDVEVYVFGIGDIYRFGAKVKSVPWQDDQEAYRRSLSLCDIHICPLKHSPWAAGKSDLKAMESSMAGAWPIVSTAEPYKPWHDRTMVCKTAKDWMKALRWAVLHRDEIPALAAEAKAYVLAERTIDKHIAKWREAISG